MPLNKPWTPYDPGDARHLPGNLGVYELADAEGRTIYIGYAGGRSLFGLRSLLMGHFSEDEPNPAIRDRAASYRYEINQMYMTRWRDLLLRHAGTEGRFPDGNEAGVEPLPRMRNAGFGTRGH